MTFYSSSDTNAPVLRGSSPGDFINLLTKCLVDGYEGKAAAGWSRPFISGNIAVFKSGAGSNGMHLRVDDTSTSTGERAARVIGYEAMTDVNTGTGLFPTQNQESGGLKWFTHYGSGSVANPRQWMLIANSGFFCLTILTYPEQASSTYYRETYWFGDLEPLGAADVYATCIQGKSSTSSPNSSESFPLDSYNLASSTVGSGLYLARSYNGLGGSLYAGRMHDYAKSNTLGWGANGSLQYPHGPDGALLMSKISVFQPGSTNQANIRGTLPGMWAPLQYVLNSGDTFDGQGDLAGKSFVAWRQNENRVVLETSNTW